MLHTNTHTYNQLLLARAEGVHICEVSAGGCDLCTVTLLVVTLYEVTYFRPNAGVTSSESSKAPSTVRERSIMDAHGMNIIICGQSTFTH